MKSDFLILGGGVAGLSAANQLADAGAQVVLLESGSYPAHKICGEFISPEALPLLKRWGIDPPIKISRFKLISSGWEWQMELPAAGSSLSRYILDEALALRAQARGVQIQTNAQIKNLLFPEKAGEPYTALLASGEEWSSSTLLISAGRLVSTLLGQHPSPRYIGVKAHFQGVELEELIMHISKGAYFGLSPIDRGRVNVAGIIACSSAQMENPKRTFEALLASDGLQPLFRRLASGSMVYDDWLIGTVPEFGVRAAPYWPGVYLLGDAAGVIAPATGNGLAMALSSGVLAASCALEGKDQLYKRCWDKEYRGRIARGRLLHQLFLSGKWIKAATAAAQLFPFLPRYLFNATRGER